MKRILLTIFVISLSLAIISAQVLIATTDDIQKAGITPDKPIRYAIERGFDRITEIFSDNARVKHAQERLAEVRVMIVEIKIKESEKALEKFNRVYSRTKNKTRLEEDKILADNLGQRVSNIASSNIGGLNESQRQEIKEIIDLYREDKLKNISRDIEDIRVCTMDVKRCSDGSYVGRHGNNCKFDDCPIRRY